MTKSQISSRPGTVTFVFVVVIVCGVYELAASVFSLVLLFRPGQVQLIFDRQVDDWFWMLLAGVSLALALAFLWIARRYADRDHRAWLLVNAISALAIVFGLLQVGFGSGYLVLATALVALIVNSTTSCRRWFATA